MKILIIIFSFLLLLSCSHYPEDPKHTMDEVSNGLLKVGYSENRPWVIKSADSVGGIEAEIIKKFARKHHAKIIWINGSEEVLFKKLEKNELDIVIAGLTNKTPWKEKKIGITRPYLKKGKKKHVVAIEQGENRFQVELEKFMYQHQQQ